MPTRKFPLNDLSNETGSCSLVPRIGHFELIDRAKFESHLFTATKSIKQLSENRISSEISSSPGSHYAFGNGTKYKGEFKTFTNHVNSS